MDNIIKFRSKFTKLILYGETETQAFSSAFEKFFALSKEDAIDILWRMTYEQYSSALWTISLDPESISPEMYLSNILRNELRYQYEEHSQQLLLTSADVPDSHKEAFKALSNSVDLIVANVVYQHCLSYLHACSAEQNRILFLLNNSEEKNFFGGLRALGFTCDESVYLKPFHILVHDLFQAMVENHQFETLHDLPFTDTREVDEKSTEEVVHEEAPAAPAFSFKDLSPESVLTYKEAFVSFAVEEDMNALIQIGQFGFNLNDVLAKKEKIHNLLKAAQVKEEADANFLKASNALSN